MCDAKLIRDHTRRSTHWSVTLEGGVRARRYRFTQMECVVLRRAAKFRRSIRLAVRPDMSQPCIGNGKVDFIQGGLDFVAPLN